MTSDVSPPDVLVTNPKCHKLHRTHYNFICCSLSALQEDEIDTREYEIRGNTNVSTSLAFWDASPNGLKKSILTHSYPVIPNGESNQAPLSESKLATTQLKCNDIRPTCQDEITNNIDGQLPKRDCIFSAIERDNDKSERNLTVTATQYMFNLSSTCEESDNDSVLRNDVLLQPSLGSVVIKRRNSRGDRSASANKTPCELDVNKPPGVVYIRNKFTTSNDVGESNEGAKRVDPLTETEEFPKFTKTIKGRASYLPEASGM